MNIVFFGGLLDLFMERYNLILTSQEDQYISLGFFKMYLKGSIESPIKVALHRLENIVHLCGIWPAFNFNKSISVEKSHEFTGLNSGRHDN